MRETLGHYLASSGDDGDSPFILPWQKKSCRKSQHLVWKSVENRLIDDQGLAMAVEGYEPFQGR